MQLSLWPTLQDETSGVHQRPGQASTLTEPHANSAEPLERLQRRAERYVESAHAENTRRAYQAGWEAFETWCAERSLSALPASVSTLALYLTHLAERGLKASSIRRARVAIGQAHGHAGAPRPDRDARIRALERGIARTHGSREEGAPPLLEHELARAVETLGHSAREDRDRAMLLVGFAGAFRASELAGLNMEDVSFVDGGADILVRRAKEDQIGKGQTTRVPQGQNEKTCPVAALRVWMGRVGRATGPLFRVVAGSQVEHQRIHPRAVTRAVQRAVERAGLEKRYSAHSLRGGLATSAYAHGATRREIQLHGRWMDPRSVDRYVKLEHIPGRRNIASGLFETGAVRALLALHLAVSPRLCIRDVVLRSRFVQHFEDVRQILSLPSA